MRFPGAVRIAHAHHQDAPVAVQVLLVQAVLLVEQRIRTHARAYEARPVGQGELGPVGVETRNDVERARVEDARDLLVGRVALKEALDEVQRGGAPGHLERVDVRLDQEGRLVEVGARLEVRDRRQPDVTALVRLADRLHANELRAL